jgi:hypothetical protein
MEILFDIQPEPLAERVAHVERSSADLHRGGRHRGRAAAAVVGVSVDRERQGEITRGAVGLTHDLPPDRKGSGGESAASLIQSLTPRPIGSICGFQLCRYFFCGAMSLFSQVRER